ncbi:MAG: acetylglutamate kinase [Chloroflexota bacterium]
MRKSAVVVKLGGTTIGEEHDVLSEIATLGRERPLVVVHGGGKRLTLWLERLGVESHFDAGLRVTDDAALDVAVAVLGGLVNAELVAALLDMGAEAVGLSGVDGGMIRGPRSERLGRVIARPDTDAALLSMLLQSGRLPVVAPMGIDEDGLICNVNADDAAASISAAIGGELVLLTDTDGVRDAEGRRIAELTPAAAEQLIESGVIAGGMVPKVRCALRAIGPGSRASRAVVADGRRPNALRGALYEGLGTGFRIS